MLQFKKRTISVVLAVLFVLSSMLLAACGEKEIPVVYMDLIAGTETNYVVMRGDTSSSAETESAIKLRKAISETTGIDIMIETDWVKRNDPIPETGFEILVGKTNRPESDISALGLTDKDFYIGRIGDRIVIRGLNDATTDQAVDYFITNYVVDGKVTIPENLNLLWRFQYPASAITINGSSIEEYQIVYAVDDYGFGKATAETLQASIQELSGKVVPIVDDSAAEIACEILIGDTSRSASAAFASDSLADLEYGFTADGTKVAINGTTYLLGVASNAFFETLQPAELYTEVKAEITSATTNKVEFTYPKSFIVVISDGLGDNHINYSLDNGLDGFVARLFPNQGHCTTYSANAAITDSAASATAISTGYKTNNYMVGVLPDGSAIPVLGELVKEVGKELILYTTDDIRSATPAGFSAHASDRNDYTTIEACQDALDPLYCSSVSLDQSETNFLAILDLIDETANPNGFFMMYEEAYTDKGGHANDFDTVYAACERVNKNVFHALNYVLENPDTALIVTADHECGGIMYNEAMGYYFTSGNHTAADVPLFAIGYGTEVFDGITCDDTEIGKWCAYMMYEDNWGDPNLEMTIDLSSIVRP